MSGYWEELERPAPDSVRLAHGEVRAGSRVRLRPRAGGDVFDAVLAGRVAIVEGVEQDMEGNIVLAVVVEDDPGRDLGLARQPGHRFFFSPAEVEILEPATGPGEVVPGTAAPAPGDGAPPRILVAGIGNVFAGDDGFGVALADRLWRRELPPGVRVIDYGIRGVDLAFAIQEGYDAVVLLDAIARGDPPGTLSVIEVGPEDEPPREVAVDAHGMDPVSVIALVRSFGGTPPPIYVVGCEAATVTDGEEVVAVLSEPVRAALEPAVRLVQSVLADIRSRQEVSRS